MTPARRQFLGLATTALAAGLLPKAGSAEVYPAHAVRIMVGFPPGIAPDIVTRMIAQSLSTQLGQQFVVENRPGGASNLGTEAVVRAAPDGLTLLTVTANDAINATLYDALGYEFLRDITPVAGMMRSANVIVVHPAVPAVTLADFIAYAKAHPGVINYASAGRGSATHLAVELFRTMAGIDLVHIPYRANYFPDLLAGRVQAAFTPIAQSVEFIRAGQLRALAVTGAARSAVLPEIPTVATSVPGYEAYVWNGLGAPRATPAGIVARLNGAINGALADPDIVARLADLGAEPIPQSAAQFGQFVADETAKWGRLIRSLGITSN